MIKKIIGFIIINVLICQNCVYPQLNVVPSIQEWEKGSGYYRLSATSRIVVANDQQDPLSNDLEVFIQDLARITGLYLEVNTGEPKKGDLYFEYDPEDNALGDEGYLMNINQYISIKAAHKRGVFYGMQTLLQLFNQGLKIPRGEARDVPDYPERGIMLDIGRKYFSIDYLEKTIRDLAWRKMNFIHLHFTEWHSFRLKSDLFPGLSAEKSYSKQDIRRIQDYAAKYHVMVIPEIDLPAHATTITDYNPYLAFQCPSMRSARWQGDSTNREGRAWILDVTRTEVRSWVKALLDEWIPLFDAPYFHIGGDEWQYDVDKYACPELMEAMKKQGYQYPGDLLVDWINEINEHIKSYGKTTQIWNWWRFSPNEKMQNKTSIQPSKDIVINVWNRPRLDDILADGYQVIITSEEGDEGLYITPAQGRKPGDYGYFNAKVIYEQWEPQRAANIRGFKACIWADRVEHKADEWFDQFADLPKSVLAERLWGGPRDKSIEKFQERIKKIGTPPFTKENPK